MLGTGGINDNIDKMKNKDPSKLITYYPVELRANKNLSVIKIT